MRIAFFLEIFYPEINGVLTSTINLAENLKRRGHRVLIVAPAHKDFRDTVLPNGLEVFYVRSFSTFIYPGIQFTWPWDRSLWRKLKSEGFDILHITGPWTLAASAIKFARRLGIPVVHTFHTMLNEDTYLRYLVKVRLLLPLVRRLVWNYLGTFIKPSTVTTAPSLYATQELRRRFPACEVLHIYNGMDVSVFDHPPGFGQTAARFPGFTGKTFLFIGRLGFEKSIDVLLTAFSLALKRRADLHLLIVGDGPARAELVRLADRLGLRDRHVRFTGRIGHTELLQSGLLHHALAFVTASVTENQPMTVIEAICAGTPVVVADVQGINELVDGNGLLFRPGDTEDLSRCLLSCAEEPQTIERLRHGALRLKDAFDGRRVAERFEDIYRQASERLRGGPHA